MYLYFLLASISLNILKNINVLKININYYKVPKVNSSM